MEQQQYIANLTWRLFSRMYAHNACVTWGRGKTLFPTTASKSSESRYGACNPMDLFLPLPSSLGAAFRFLGVEDFVKSTGLYGSTWAPMYLFMENILAYYNIMHVFALE